MLFHLYLGGKEKHEVTTLSIFFYNTPFANMVDTLRKKTTQKSKNWLIETKRMVQRTVKEEEIPTVTAVMIPTAVCKKSDQRLAFIERGYAEFIFAFHNVFFFSSHCFSRKR